MKLLFKLFKHQSFYIQKFDISETNMNYSHFEKYLVVYKYRFHIRSNVKTFQENNERTSILCP